MMVDTTDRSIYDKWQFENKIISFRDIGSSQIAGSICVVTSFR